MFYLRMIFDQEEELVWGWEEGPDPPVLTNWALSRQLQWEQLPSQRLLLLPLLYHCHQLPLRARHHPLVSSSLMFSVQNKRGSSFIPRRTVAIRWPISLISVCIPTSCFKFYKCANGTLTLETCGNGLLFDERRGLAGSAHNHCSYNWEAECGDRPADDTPISTPGCEYQFGIFPSGEGCFASYTKCANGVPKEVKFFKSIILIS